MTRSAVPVLTIDGPSGSGKGTISRRVADRLGWHLLDSGALYRLVALAGQLAGPGRRRRGRSRAPGRGRCRSASADARRTSEADPAGRRQRDVTGEIRTEEAGQGASRVAVWPQVRAALLERQQDFAQPPGLVADGRDMGTVVFPCRGPQDLPHGQRRRAGAQAL